MAVDLDKLKQAALGLGLPENEVVGIVEIMKSLKPEESKAPEIYNPATDITTQRQIYLKGLEESKAPEIYNPATDVTTQRQVYLKGLEKEQVPPAPVVPGQKTLPPIEPSQPKEAAGATLPSMESAQQSAYQRAWEAAVTTKERDAIADSWKKARGYELFESKPLSEQEKAEQKKQEAASLAVEQLRAIINAYYTVPEEQRGIIEGRKQTLPGIGPVWAPEASAYEDTRRGLAAILGPIVGGGSGSGLRINDYELKHWANLLPSVLNPDEKNAKNLRTLDSLVKARFGRGIFGDETKAPLDFFWK
jgi:hypothetical protein